MSNVVSMVFKKTMLAAACLALTACATSIQSVPVTKPVPEQMPVVEQPSDASLVGVNDVQNEQWWALFNDPQLSAVIEQALVHNTDVRLAEQHLNEAGAMLGIAKSDRWPAIYGQFSESRNKPTRAGSQAPLASAPSVSNSIQLGLGASWELDLWGRLGALQDAAAASFMQQGYNLKGVRLSVSAAVARLYAQIRVNGLRIEVAEKTLESRKQALEFSQKRADVGLIDDLAFRQAESEYLAVKAQLPDLREAYANSVNAMSVLVGGNTPVIPVLNVDDLVVSKTVVVPEGTSSDLLLRRPDLAAAEQQLLASQANVIAARKAFFPSISLTAFAGRESAVLDNLFTGPAKVWNFSANITQPIFQAGALMNEQDASVARNNLAVITYEAAIRNAFSEVYDAIVAQSEARERLTARSDQVASLQKVVDLAGKRVDAGVSNQLELLDAQRNLLSAQLDWAQAWGLQQNSLFTMVTALGGGFNQKEALVDNQ